MTEARHWDALIVVNRRTDPGAMVDACQRHALGRVLILSSHGPFAAEKVALAAAVPASAVEFVTLAELFSDADLAGIEDGITRQLQAANVPPARYVDAYEEAMNEARNTAAWERLTRRGTFGRILVADGLGITARTWKAVGALPLGPASRSGGFRRSTLGRWLADLRERWQPRRAVTLLADGADNYFFIRGTRRLRLRPGTEPQTVSWPRKVGPHEAHFAATALHDYSPAVHQLGLPVRVFVDSYLPTNYPPSYLGSYGPATFVCPDPFSARWLASHGREVMRPPAFVATPTFAVARPPAGIRTIVLLLNHAGDWSALIHRSDTDRLVESFCGLARRFPAHRWIVRPHPGMDQPRHEGAGASARLAALVAGCQLGNLSVSSGPLTADLERGDLFLSEYSATLIDAWQSGRLGLAVNLTGRRSLMQDFAELGFALVSSPSALQETIERIIAEPGELAERQSAAAARYNEALQRHLAG